MLKEYWETLSGSQKTKFVEITGISSGVMSSKYLRLNPIDRAKPRTDSFERILSAIQKVVSPDGIQISRADLALYFYAPPSETGQESLAVRRD